MNLYFIEKYIQRIKKEDIYNYAKSQEISLTEEELELIYKYLKTNYKLFLINKEKRLELLNNLKSNLNNKASSKLDELYNLYKNKI